MVLNIVMKTDNVMVQSTFRNKLLKLKHVTEGNHLSAHVTHAHKELDQMKEYLSNDLLLASYST